MAIVNDNTIILEKSDFSDKYLEKIPHIFSSGAIGRYCNLSTYDNVLDALTNIAFEHIKYLPKSNLDMYVAIIDVGYRDKLNKKEIIESIKKEKINKDAIATVCTVNSAFLTFIYLEDILDINILLTNKTYLIYDRVNKELIDISIGPFINPGIVPNFLKYITEEKIPLLSLLRLPTFNKIIILEERKNFI